MIELIMEDKENQSPLTIGQKLYVTASHKNFGIIEAVAANIASECRKQNLNPLDYQIDKKKHSEFIDNLLRIANRNHEDLLPRQRPELTPDKMLNDYNTSFRLASSKFMDMPLEELEARLKMFENIRKRK